MVNRLLPLGLLLGAGCFGRIEVTDSALTLPFHASIETLESLPRASIAPAAAVVVPATVTFRDVVGYYAKPIGFFLQDASFSESRVWAQIEATPTPEQALHGWLSRSVSSSGGGPELSVQVVITHLEWHMLDVRTNAGRVATTLSVTDPRGAVRFVGQRVTAGRVPFLDALLRTHVREWLADEALMTALGAGSHP
jgi:hypothetical protein